MQVWLQRAAVFAVWALVGLSVAFWASRWMGRAQPSSASAPLAASHGLVTPPEAQAIAAALRGPRAKAVSAPEVAAAAIGPNLTLLGIVRSARAGDSLAMISVDNQAAKPFRVGASIAPGWVVQAVKAREVLIGPDRTGPTVRTLEVPRKP